MKYLVVGASAGAIAIAMAAPAVAQDAQTADDGRRGGVDILALAHRLRWRKVAQS